LLPLLRLDPHDARYAGSAERLKNGDELDALVAGWVGARPAADVVAALDAARIPVTLVNDLATLSADPHVQARGSITTVDDDDLGPVLMPAPFPHLNTTPGAIAWAGRPAGADTDTVCRDWLGLGPSDTDALRRSGAIS